MQALLPNLSLLIPCAIVNTFSMIVSFIHNLLENIKVLENLSYHQPSPLPLKCFQPPLCSLHIDVKLYCQSSGPSLKSNVVEPCFSSAFCHY